MYQIRLIINTWKWLSSITKLLPISSKKFIWCRIQTSFTACSTAAAVLWLVEVLIDVPLQYSLSKQNTPITFTLLQIGLFHVFIAEVLLISSGYIIWNTRHQPKQICYKVQFYGQIVHFIVICLFCKSLLII